MQFTEPIQLTQDLEIPMEMEDSEISAMADSETLIQMVASEVIPEGSETEVQEVSEILSPMVDSVILHHKQDLITIISSRSQDTITEVSGLMIPEASDPAEVSMAEAEASEVVLQAEAE